MPSEEVSIGDDPPEIGSRASWKAGEVTIVSGIPLAGRRAWRAFQNSSETTVRAGELPWEAATAFSISTMSVNGLSLVFSRICLTWVHCQVSRCGGSNLLGSSFI
jgi:hypothetical protein